MPRKISLWLFTAVVCAFYCASITLIEFSALPINGLLSFLRTSLLFILTVAATYGVIAFLSSNRYLFAIVFPILAGFSAAMCYLKLTIGSNLSSTSIEIALGNDADMWFTVITPGLATTIILCFIVGIGFAYIRWTRVRSTGYLSLTMAITGGVIMIGAITIHPRVSRFLGYRLPYSIYSSFNEYYNNKVESSIERTTFVNTPAIADVNAPDIIFVIGEALRADHLPMNGYHRNTLPKISKDSLLINFSNLWTNYTHTNSAVPNLLTRYCPDDPNRMFDEQSFITIFKNAGYKTAWFANQNPTKSFTYFANEADTIFYCNNGNTEFHYDTFLDTNILPPFEKWFNRCDSIPQLAVIHTIGSHWWYPSHYINQDAIYQPEIKHKEIARLENNALINSYDNTIIATDRFLSQLRSIINNRNAIIFYISDHGELLGENGQFLHGVEHPATQHPASLMLPTKKYLYNFPEIVDSLRIAASQPISSNFTFHTVIRLAHITTPAYNPDSTFINGRRLK